MEILVGLRVNTCSTVHLAIPTHSHTCCGPAVPRCLQMFPFLHLPTGTAVSLHEATTPSPLFTWFPSPTNVVPDITLAELDTCVKYSSSQGSAAHAQANLGVQADFSGSTSFSTVRRMVHESHGFDA